MYNRFQHISQLPDAIKGFCKKKKPSMCLKYQWPLQNLCICYKIGFGVIQVQEMRRMIWSWSMTAENRGWAGDGVCLLWGFGLELGGVGLCGVEGGCGVLYKWWLHTVWPISLRAVKSIRSISVSPWSERGEFEASKGHDSLMPRVKMLCWNWWCWHWCWFWCRWWCRRWWWWGQWWCISILRAWTWMALFDIGDIRDDDDIGVDDGDDLER